MKKFIESKKIDDYEILTDDGFKPIVASHKTIKYDIWKLETKSFNIECADDHIVFDKYFNAIYIKDLSLGDLIHTENGLEMIISLEKTESSDNMYDLELSDDSNRRYYTNGILSHNTMTLSALTAGFVKSGKDVLYITLEMSQENISKLIDANYLNNKINDITEIDCNKFKTELIKLKNKNVGRLFVTEFPTGNASVNNFRSLLDDLKYKKEFIPKIIIVDYINIMKSDRYSDSNLYVTVKGITEELRGLAVEGPYCIVSATQTNRTGAQSSDISMTDTAESYGLPQTVDLLIGMMTSDDLKEENLLIWKSLKNRIAGIVGYRFPVKTRFDFAQLVDCDREYNDLVKGEDEKMKNVMSKMKNRDKLKQLKVNIKKAKEINDDSDEKIFNF